MLAEIILHMHELNKAVQKMQNYQSKPCSFCTGMAILLSKYCLDSVVIVL